MKYYKQFLFSFCSVLMILLCSCSNQKGTATNETLDSVKKIADIRADYQKEANELKKESGGKMDFKKCKFQDFPDTDCVSVLRLYSEDISVDEGIRVVRDWLEKIGKKDYDLEKSLQDDSGQAGDATEQDGHLVWPLVFENKEKLKNGNAFYINTKECHLQLAGSDGYFSMSDGTITKYLKSDSLAGIDAMGVNQEETVAEGTVEEMGPESYNLISGKVSVADAAGVVKNYFETGVPYPPAENVTVDIPYVRVFRLADRYGYAFSVRRKYQNIPISYKDTGERKSGRSDEKYDVAEDSRKAYVADGDHVCAFAGISDAQKIEVKKTEASMISLKNAVAILNQKLARELKVDVSEVELEYCPCRISDMEFLAEPCWMFDGVCRNNDQRIRIYFYTLKGDINYYLYPSENK